MFDSNNVRKKDMQKKPDKQDAGKTGSPSKDVTQVRKSKSDRTKTTFSASGNQFQNLGSPSLESKKSKVKISTTDVTQETSVEPRASESASANISKPESPSFSGDSDDSEEAHDINSGVVYDSKGIPVDLNALIQASIQAHLKKGYLTDAMKEPVENPKRVGANESKGNFITYFYSICV